MKRIDAIKAICEVISENDVVVSTTGEISRELFAVRDDARNFYMQGSMGLASSIGLGLAMCRPESRIVVLEGDGSILMNMGSMATIGHIHPRNLIHVVLDNEAYDSCGGQVSASSTTKLDKVAEAVGYRRIIKTDSVQEIKQALNLDDTCPCFILAKIDRGGPQGIPRVKIKPEENKRRFEVFLSEIQR